MSLEDLTAEARDELALLARQLAENPKTRKQFLRMTRDARPNMPVPELDIEDKANSVLEAANARVEALENKLREKDATDELERRRNSLVEKHLVRNKDEVAEVEKLMLENGIQNHETAAQYHAWMKQAATPTPSTYRGALLDKSAQSTLSAYWKNPQGAARNEAAQAISELRSGKVTPS